jgi:hypothetical protein
MIRSVLGSQAVLLYRLATSLPARGLGLLLLKPFCGDAHGLECPLSFTGRRASPRRYQSILHLSSATPNTDPRGNPYRRNPTAPSRVHRYTVSRQPRTH